MVECWNNGKEDERVVFALAHHSIIPMFQSG
jgi:hypothetical protein